MMSVFWKGTGSKHKDRMKKETIYKERKDIKFYLRNSNI